MALWVHGFSLLEYNNPGGCGRFQSFVLLFSCFFFQKLVIGNFLFPLSFRGINSELFLSKRSSYLEILWKLDVLGNKTKSVEFEEKQNRAKTQ